MARELGSVRDKSAPAGPGCAARKEPGMKHRGFMMVLLVGLGALLTRPGYCQVGTVGAG